MEKWGVLSIFVLFTSFCGIPIVICDAGGGGGGGSHYSACLGDESHNEASGGSPLVAELRRRIRNLNLNSYYTTDRQLSQYIEDADYRISVAEKMLRDTAAWRKRNGMDTILTWTPSHILASSFPFTLLGYSNEGNPVISFPVGRWDYSRVLNSGYTKEDLVRYEQAMLEHAKNATYGLVHPRTHEAVDQVIFVVDFGGISLKDLIVVRRHLAHIKLFQAIDRHFPYLTKKWFVVNIPRSFASVWKILRKFLSRRFASQFSVYARGVDTRISGCGALLHNLPKSVIPPELHCKVPTPACLTPFTADESFPQQGYGPVPVHGHGPIPIPIQLPVSYGPPQIQAGPALQLQPVLQQPDLQLLSIAPAPISAPQLQYFQPSDSLYAGSSNNETSIAAVSPSSVESSVASPVPTAESRKTSFV